MAEVTTETLIEEYVDEINALITAKAHVGPHDPVLHNPQITPPQPGLRHCPRCRLNFISRRVAEMVGDLDDVAPNPAFGGKSKRDATLESLKRVRASEAVGPVQPSPAGRP